MSTGPQRAITPGEVPRVPEIMRDPMAWPAETKTYIVDLVQIAGIDVPASNIRGLYTTSSTINGLGNPTHGKPVMIRAGTSPYEFVQMTYDETYGKWVTAATIQGFQIASGYTTNSTSYQTVSETYFPLFFIPDFKVLYDAGLRPQALISANLGTSYSAGSGVNGGYCRAALFEFNDGDNPASGTLVAHSGEVVVTHNLSVGSNFDLKVSGWQDMTFDATPAKAHVYVRPQVKNGTISGTPSGPVSELDASHFLFRWVANPV